MTMEIEIRNLWRHIHGSHCDQDFYWICVTHSQQSRLSGCYKVFNQRYPQPRSQYLFQHFYLLEPVFSLIIVLYKNVAQPFDGNCNVIWSKASWPVCIFMMEVGTTYVDTNVLYVFSNIVFTLNHSCHFYEIVWVIVGVMCIIVHVIVLQL